MNLLKDTGAVVTATSISSARVARQSFVASALLPTFMCFATVAHGQEPNSQSGAGATAPEGSDVAETGKKLSNPLSNVWALFTEFDTTFSNGKANSGHKKVGSRMIFQPIVPIPLFGEGEKEWRFIRRSHRLEDREVG